MTPDPRALALIDGLTTWRDSETVKAKAAELGISEWRLRQARKHRRVIWRRVGRRSDHRTLWILPEALAALESRAATPGVSQRKSPSGEPRHPEWAAVMAARERFRQPLSGRAVR